MAGGGGTVTLLSLLPSLSRDYSATITHSCGITIKWSQEEIRRLKKIYLRRKKQERNSRMLEHKLSGMTYEEIGKMENLHPQHVVKLISKEVKRRKEEERRLRDEYIASLFLQENIPVKTLCKKFNLERTIIYRIIRKAKKSLQEET
jgi:Mor family transcriptional regulator